MASGPDAGWLARQSAAFCLLVAVTAAGGPVDGSGEAVDWAEFRRLARRHGLATYAFRMLTDDAAAIRPPAAVRSEMRDESRALIGENLRMAAETERVCRGFSDHGIPHVVLKGAALGVAIYGGRAMRDAVDIDMLVPAPAVVRSLAVLDGLGYGAAAGILGWPGLGTVRGYIGKDRVVRHIDWPFVVDLHWRPTENPYYFSLPTGFCQAIGDGLPHLAPLDWVLFLIAHAAQSHFTQLKWLADIPRMMARYPEVTASALIAEGAVRGLSRPVRQTLGLLDIVYGMAPPDDGHDDGAHHYLVADALSAIAGDTALGVARSPLAAPEVARRLRYRLALSTDWRYRLFEIARPAWKWTGV